MWVKFHENWDNRGCLEACGEIPEDTSWYVTKASSLPVSFVECCLMGFQQLLDLPGYPGFLVRVGADKFLL